MANATGLATEVFCAVDRIFRPPLWLGCWGLGPSTTQEPDYTRRTQQTCPSPRCGYSPPRFRFDGPLVPCTWWLLPNWGGGGGGFWGQKITQGSSAQFDWARETVTSGPCYP